MVRSSAPETRGTPQWRQRTAVAEFSRSQDGQFMAEHSVRGHQKRDYPVALAQPQEDSKPTGCRGRPWIFEVRLPTRAGSLRKTIFYVRGLAERTGRVEYG